MAVGVRSPRWVRPAIASLIGRPGTMVGQIRRILLAFCLAWIVLGLPMLRARFTATDLALAVPSVIALVLLWIWGLRRQYLPAWEWLAEALCVGVVLTTAELGQALTLLFVWINYRALFGTLRTKVFGTAVAITTLGVSGVLAHYPPTRLVPLAFTAVLLACITHLLATTGAGRDRATAREHAITAAGTALAAAVSREEAINVALVAALGMGTEVGAAVVATLAGSTVRVKGAVGRCEPAACDTIVELAVLPGDVLSALTPGGHALLRGESAVALAGTLKLAPTAGALLVPLALQGTAFGLMVFALDQVPSDDLSSAASTLADAVAVTLDRLLTSTRLGIVVEHAPDALFLTDVTGRIRFANPAAEALVGRPAADLVAVNLGTMIHPDDLGPPVRAAGHGPRLVRVQGEDGWIETETVVEQVTERDGSTSLVVTVRDISERQRLELELRHAQKLESVGRLAAGVAHEINTPIQFIGDNVRFLGEAVGDLLRLCEAHRALAEVVDDPQARSVALDRVRSLAREVDIDLILAEVPEAISQTLEGIDRVARIVRAMKSFGHPGNEEKTEVDLNEAVTSTLTVANNELKYVAEVVTEVGELPPVLCHRGDINQVVLNLVINAAHAVAASADERGRGEIRVRTRADNGWAVIEVADTGTGIPPAIADKVFDQFFTTKEVGTGTGQGLALARSLVVERHGGTIDFTSEVGVGTTFTVRLPLAGQDAPLALAAGATSMDQRP
jgi:PAS domain S-box-containing protein